MTSSLIPYDAERHTYRMRDQHDGLMYPLTKEDGVLGYPPEWKAVAILEQRPDPFSGLQDVLREHPEWLESVCPPITGHLTLAQALIQGVPVRLEDRQVARLLRFAPAPQLKGLLEPALAAHRFLVADALWRMGVRFATPPSADLAGLALLDPWQDWDAPLKQGKAPLRKPGSPEAGPALRQGLLWFQRMMGAGLNPDAALPLQINGVATSWPLVFLAVWTCMKQMALRDEGQSWNQAWLKAAEGAKVDWGQPIQGLSSFSEEGQPLFSVLERYLLPAQAAEVQGWHLGRRLDSGEAASPRLRM